MAEETSGDQVVNQADSLEPTPTGGIAEPEEGIQPSEYQDPWMNGFLRATPSWLVSAVVNTVILLVLALIGIDPPDTQARTELVAKPDVEESLDEIDEIEDELLDEVPDAVSDFVVDAPMPEDVANLSAFDDLASAPISMELDTFGLEHAPRNDLMTSVGAYTGSDLSGRGNVRTALGAGATTESLAAVGAALKWLAGHQLPDGSWSFDHTVCPNCRGQCRNPGELRDARNGATAMALLPFLGAGQTHIKGDYKKTVERGLYYLIRNIKLKPGQGGSFFEGGGSMYSHGLASIAMCEAYAMTQDRALYEPAQASLNFICYAQDPGGGGWRYSPQQAGDTSAVGWQIMALKSGHMAYLSVPPVVVKKASLFLDSVQSNNGAHYGYTGPAANRDATTAIGLLCRMYLGWKKESPALEQGVKWISNRGPSAGNSYYNYYATQVMHHWEGELWDKWNEKMRKQLVTTQATKGHEKGSWSAAGDHGGRRGGRLYSTSMATMVLEVYFRHLPIYRKQSTEQEFPLD